MAKEMSPAAAAAAEERIKLKEEKKQFKQEQKAQKKEAKRRAAEIARHEEDLGEDSGNGVVTFFATVLIVLLWLAVACVIVKMDIGGFGSSVLTPILKDVPVLNMILPGTSSSPSKEADEEGYGGYASIEEAVEYIRQLELELERAQTASNAKDADLESLKAEVLRLQEFEQKQTEFQRIKNEFYEEVVYSDKGPGLEEYLKYYESMDPTTAETLAKQVMLQQQENAKFQEYAQGFASMKPQKAASLIENLDDLNLAARILNALTVDERASILNVMDTELAAKIVKMMNPDS